MTKFRFALLLFFASALVSGCTNTVLTNRSNSYSKSHVRITDQDNREKEYFILSVRGDSALVVLDWVEAGIEPIPFSHAIVLTKDIISEVHRFGNGKVGSTVGALMTETAGIVWALSKETPGPFEGLGTLLVSGIAWIPGIAIGYLTGEIAQPSRTFTLDSDKDWQYLRQVSTYPDKEPEIMQYIK